MSSAFMLAYGAVFAAELVGDKLLYTTGTLATRYRAPSIVAGVTAAIAVKMGAAVLIGAAIASIPRLLVASLTTISFLSVAVAVLRKSHDSPRGQDARDRSRGALMSFTLVLGSEWGDLGQITAATMAAQLASPVAVWLGAVCAMSTKGLLAAWLGARVRIWLRERLTPRTIRYGSVILLLCVGGLSVAESLLGDR